MLTTPIRRTRGRTDLDAPPGTAHRPIAAIHAGSEPRRRGRPSPAPHGRTTPDGSSGRARRSTRPPALGHRLGNDHGSSLLLVPAGVLIVFLLAGMAVDLSGVHLAQRELLDAAASAANDAAGAGIDTTTLRVDGSVRLDADRVRTVVAQSLAAQRVRGLLPAETQVTVDPATATITVRAARRTSRVFTPALPGADRSTVVRASASASATTR